MKYRFMRFPGFMTKCVTMSFDDGSTHDKKLVEIMDKNGIKGTFNINGIHYGGNDPWRLTDEELRTLFLPNGHEVANHGMQHAAPINLTNVEGMLEVIEGRRAAEKFFDCIIRGFAFPDRTESNEDIRQYLRMSGTAYARVTQATGNFDVPQDFLAWRPTCKHTDENALQLAQRFLEAEVEKQYCARRDSLLFFVWGHSFECPKDDFTQFTHLCETLGGHDDIWYAPCIDICDYVSAYRSLIASVDNRLLYNPSTIRVFLEWDEKRYSVGPGETIHIR